jgi:uncharacterized protein (TIGR03083 family)
MSASAPERRHLGWPPVTDVADPALRHHLASDVATMGDVLLASPTAAVRHCPGWTVTDLIRHHGAVHRWAAQIVETGEPAGEREERGGPDDVAALSEWYAEGAARLLEVLERIDPQRPCWTFGRPPGIAGFWTRRQAMEAAIHRWDAQDAVDAAAGFPAEIAATGITEVVDGLFPRQIALGRTPPLSASVVLRATDLDRTWGLPSERLLGPDLVGEVAGPADSLLLLLWRRAGLDDARITVEASDELRAELVATRFAP